jgi:hypothetical protein
MIGCLDFSWLGLRDVTYACLVCCTSTWACSSTAKGVLLPDSRDIRIVVVSPMLGLWDVSN